MSDLSSAPLRSEPPKHWRGPDRETVMVETDAALLTQWYLDSIDIGDRIKAQLDGHGAAGTASADWRNQCGKKLAYLSLLRRWVSARLLELGLPVPRPADDPLKLQVARLEARVVGLKQRLREAGLPTGDDDA